MQSISWFDLTAPEEDGIQYPPEAVSDLAAVTIESNIKHLTREDAQELIMKLVHYVEKV